MLLILTAWHALKVVLALESSGVSSIVPGLVTVAIHLLALGGVVRGDGSTRQWVRVLSAIAAVLLTGAAILIGAAGVQHSELPAGMEYLAAAAAVPFWSWSWH